MDTLTQKDTIQTYLGQLPLRKGSCLGAEAFSFIIF